MREKLPTFLIVGAARAGTTSLFYYLNEHPEVFIHKKKEGMFFSNLSTQCNGPGRYFNDSVITSLNEYESLFDDVKDEKSIGDISPDYLYYYENSIGNISRVLGKDVKIIIILRNPSDRIYSQYFHHLKFGVEPLSIEDALANEVARMASNWFWTYYYTDVGFYSEQVKGYLTHFRNVRIYLYEELESDAMKLVKDIFSYIGVDPDFSPNIDFRYHVSGAPRNKAIGFLVKSLANSAPEELTKTLYRSLKTHKKTRKFLEGVYARLLTRNSVKKDTKALLKDLYFDDIMRLQGLIQRDLSPWLR